MIEHLIIVDLEATCWDWGLHPDKRPDMETIEIGAVKVDTQTFEIVSEFQSFVKPILYPELTNYCKKLTHITQDDTDNANEFGVVYRHFCKWLKNEDFMIASWGAYDKNQLKIDCQRHGVKYLNGCGHINLKTKFSEFRGTRKGKGVRKALRILGLDFIGTPHRGIDDAKNIYRIVKAFTKGDISSLISST